MRGIYRYPYATLEILFQRSRELYSISSGPRILLNQTYS